MITTAPRSALLFSEDYPEGVAEHKQGAKNKVVRV